MLLDVLAWLVAVELVGILAFPAAFLLFRRLPDRGYSLAKPLGIAIFAYALWLLGHSGFIPNSRITIIAILVVALAAGAWVMQRRRGQLLSFIGREWRNLLVIEGVFLGFFLVWIVLVSESPAINHTEKPMDFAFLNASLVSTHLPPEDPWLSGHPVSYYYFGHFMMAFLSKLAAVPPNVGYNIAVSLVPALIAVGSFGLLYNLVRLSGGTARVAAGFGLLAPLLVTLTGNLEGTLEFLHLRAWASDDFWDWVGVKGLTGDAARGGIFPQDTWWWWRATRVIDTLQNGRSLDYTITEFPFFSFVLGDLHPHMVSLPFLMLFLALSLNHLVSEHTFAPGWLRVNLPEALGTSFLLGVVAFTNFWDFPVCLAVWALIIFLKSYAHQRGEVGDGGVRHPCQTPRLAGKAVGSGPGPGRVLTRGPLGDAAASTIVVAGAVAVAAIVLFLPFYLHLSSQASGILPVGEVATRPFLFLVVMGVPAFLGVSFLLRQLPGLPRPTRRDGVPIGLISGIVLLPFVVWLVASLVIPLAAAVPEGATAGLAGMGWRALWTLPGIAVVGVSAFSAMQRVLSGREEVLAFLLLLLAVGFLLLTGAELFFLVDLFGNRMNTVFKTYYQAWLLLGIVGGYGIYYWHSRGSPKGLRLRLGHYGWLGVVGVLVVISLYHPVGAALDRAGFLRAGHTLTDNTLDGLAFLQGRDPAEYAAIVWFREDAAPGRIVEAVGDDYSDYGRISSSTGRPTVLGWAGHEHQWRGGTELFEGRADDVAQIYQSDDPKRVAELLDRYDIRYVYVGVRELDSYGDGHLEEFGRVLRTAFEGDGVVVYERVGATQVSDGR